VTKGIFSDALLSADFVLMPADLLHLEVYDFVDADHWRWRLSSSAGAYLADHKVVLNPKDSQYGALFDLPSYLNYHAAPDKRDDDERYLMDEVGAWMGEHVLGAVGDRIIAQGGPVVVRVANRVRAISLSGALRSFWLSTSSALNSSARSHLVDAAAALRPRLSTLSRTSHAATISFSLALAGSF
jgi:hypothetical protein